MTKDKGVSDKEVAGLHFVQGTVNAQVYIGILEEKLLIDRHAD